MASRQAAMVGLTCSTIPPGAEPRPPRLGQNSTYLQALVRAGAAPVLIPHLPDLALLRPVYERVDALLLPGGGDIAPEHFGEQAHEKCGPPDPDRDRTELALARWCLEDHKPLLAICRGIQVLNVVLGGSLYQDIEAQVQGAGRHNWSSGHPRDFLAHAVNIVPGTRLAAILELGGGSLPQPVLDRAFQLEVNSFHHQAIKELAAGLRVVARAPDGIIEAVEMEGHPFALGVQWHPEELAPDDSRAQQLFGALIGAIDL
jgi:putative glutamine amidotransferase